MARIVAMMDDLFFQMKVAETAKHLGLELKVATNGDALLGLLDPAPKLVIVDLNARSQPLAVIERVRAAQKDLKVIGFLSHVQRDLAAQAHSAGCNEVMPPFRLHRKSSRYPQRRKGLTRESAKKYSGRANHRYDCAVSAPHKLHIRAGVQL